MQSSHNGFFSRETRAGYDANVIGNARVVLVGAGALGSNVALNLALLGVGEIRIIDPDVVDPSNVTRSPFFGVEQPGAPARKKAREVARGILALHRGAAPLVRYADALVESLGLACIEGVSAVISAVDANRGRRWLADATRLMEVPLVEAGFSGSAMTLTVWPNRGAEDACWRCLHPSVAGSGASCALYARRVVEEGGVPATQPVASAAAALVAEAAISAVHGRSPLADSLLTFDVRTGEARVVRVPPNPECPGVHRRLGPAQALEARSDEPLRAAIQEIAKSVTEPRIVLPHPIVLEAPCDRCGAGVPVRRPAWMLKEPPVCGDCGEMRGVPGLLEVVREVTLRDQLAATKARKLGLGPAALFEVEDASGELSAFRLAGTPDDLFTTKRRGPRNGAATASTDPIEHDEPCSEGESHG
jgi:adenylyltransferase/sulfurtransferase